MNSIQKYCLVLLFITPLLFIGKDSNYLYHRIELSKGTTKLKSQSARCYWNDKYYQAGERFCNNALQEWICNEDGSYTYTGKTGIDVCPGISVQCNWNGNFYQAGERFCNSAKQEWLCQDDGTYVFTGNTGGDACPGNMVNCYWNGNQYQPGEYFCNSANQQWLCKADGTYVYTGLYGEDICSIASQQCTWNGVTYQLGEYFCTTDCQQWVCQAGGNILFTGNSGKDLCPDCSITPTAIVVFATMTPVPFSSVCNFLNDSGKENEILLLINQLRTSANIKPLKMNEKLTIAARLHSQDMACNDYFSHIGSDDTSPYDRITKQGYSYSAAGENIAGGNSSPQTIVDGWISSEGHKRNMLSENFSEIGIGYIFFNQSTYSGYWTTTFGEPR